MGNDLDELISEAEPAVKMVLSGETLMPDEEMAVVKAFQALREVRERLRDRVEMYKQSDRGATLAIEGLERNARRLKDSAYRALTRIAEQVDPDLPDKLLREAGIAQVVEAIEDLHTELMIAQRQANPLSELQADVHAVADDKGWWDDTMERDFPTKIALCHSELSEALEELRVGNLEMRVSKDGKPEGMVVELADCVIRIMDFCEFLGLELASAIAAKHEYNKGRERRWEGKAF